MNVFPLAFWGSSGCVYCWCIFRGFFILCGRLLLVFGGNTINRKPSIGELARGIGEVQAHQRENIVGYI